MDLLRDNVRAVCRKYFLAAFGSALISCIYGVVDMAMVGQYQGPDGTAVLAVVRGILRFRDGAEPCLAEPLYPHLHAADGGDPRHGAGHHPDVCRVGHAARDAGAAVVLKPGLSAYTPFIGGDVHEALEILFVRGGISAADGGEDDRSGGGRRCARGAAAGHQRGR